MSNKRDPYIDSLKAIAIVLVVWGHAIQYRHGVNYDYWHDPLFIVIYSFHMPLFALISGYVMSIGRKKENSGIFVKKKFLHLIIPAVSWGGVIAGFNILLRITRSNQSYLAIPVDIIKGAIANPYWFLSATFIALSLIAIVQRIHVRAIKWLLYTVIFIICLITPDVLSSQEIAFTLPFFVIGFYLGKWIFREQHAITCAALVAVYTVLLLFWDKNKYVYTSGVNILNAESPACQLLTDIYRFLIGLVGSVTFAALFRKIYVMMHLNNFERFLNIGMETESIYLLSTPVFIFSHKLFAFLQKFVHVETSDVFASLVVDIGLLLVTFIFIKLILLVIPIARKWKWVDRILLGKWKI